MLDSLRGWLIRMSDVYPPKWYWPVVRIYGGPDGQDSRTCYLTRIIGPKLPLLIGLGAILKARTWTDLRATWQASRWEIGQVYLHIFHREDMDRDPHDHPFNFFTIPLNMGYTEEVFDHVDGAGCFKLVHVARFRVSFRAALHTHRVVYTDRGSWPLVTIVWRSRSTGNKWGFWCHDAAAETAPQASQRHKVRWQDYVYGGKDANQPGIDEACPGVQGGRYVGP